MRRGTKARRSGATAANLCTIPSAPTREAALDISSPRFTIVDLIYMRVRIYDISRGLAKNSLRMTTPSPKSPANRGVESF